MHAFKMSKHRTLHWNGSEAQVTGRGTIREEEAASSFFKMISLDKTNSKVLGNTNNNIGGILNQNNSLLHMSIDNQDRHLQNSQTMRKPIVLSNWRKHVSFTHRNIEKKQ